MSNTPNAQLAQLTSGLRNWQVACVIGAIDKQPA